MVLGKFSREFESEAEEILERDLLERGWTVNREPTFGNIRPDMIGLDEHGTTFVFEFKGTKDRRTITFSDLAQLKHFESVLKKELKIDKLRAVFVTNSEISPTLEGLSRDLGVLVIGVKDPGQLSNKIALLTAD